MWRDIIRSLHHRNYRNYFFGQLISLHGTQMAVVAQSWLVYSMTQSSLMLGAVHFAMLIPVLLFGLFSGVLADLVSRRMLLLFSQTGAMVLSLILAALALSGLVQLWHIIVIAFLFGITQSIDMPVRQSFLSDMVPKEQLSNAVGLNSGVFNLSRFLGPAIAGVLLLQWEPGRLFLLNGFSYLLLLYVLWSMEIPPRQRAERGRAAEALKQGVHYVWHHTVIRSALFHVGVISMMGTALIVLMPVFADRQYGGGSDTLGQLLSAAGAGSLIGAINLARKKGNALLAPSIGRAGVVGAIALALFAWNEQLYPSMVILLVAGFSVTTVVATTNSYIQAQVDDQIRGRVMSLFSMIFVGMAPFGSFTAGAVAEWIGIQSTVSIFSLLGLTAALLFLYRIERSGPSF